MKKDYLSPFVSVIIPTKNRTVLLKETIKSLLDQSFQRWEAIVVDDGSDDDTADWMTTLAKEDNRIKFFIRNKRHKGAQVCRNIGVEKSQGRYVIFLDSDDCLAPYALEQRVKVIESCSDADFIVFQCLVFRSKPGDSNVLWNIENGESNIDRFLKLDVPWSAMSPIWRKEALKIVGPWDETLICWHDWEYHLRALAQGLTYYTVPIVDCYYRLQDEKRESIGRRSVGVKALNQYIDLFINIRDLLDREGLLSYSRKQRLVALYFWLSEMWERHNKVDKAREILNFIWNNNISSYGFFIFSRLYFSRVFFISPRLRTKLRCILLSQIQVNCSELLSSKSFLKMSLSEAGLMLEETNGSLTRANPPNNIPRFNYTKDASV